MMTPATLMRCTGCDSLRAGLWADPLTLAMVEYDIDTPLRQAAFLAQVAHECGRFRDLRELWGPTPAQARYSVRADLGNTKPEAIAAAKAAGVDVGRYFSGVGPMQHTGYDNILALSKHLFGDDRLVHNPPLAMTPQVGARAAGDYWKTHALNALADAEAFETITRKINGGLNGLADRQLLYKMAKKGLES